VTFPMMASSFWNRDSPDDFPVRHAAVGAGKKVRIHDPGPDVPRSLGVRPHRIAHLAGTVSVSVPYIIIGVMGGGTRSARSAEDWSRTGWAEPWLRSSSCSTFSSAACEAPRG
jgi:hypothetical protein